MIDPEAFIRAETAPGRPPLVPEIELNLASAITPIWQASEARLAETGVAPPYWAFAWPGGQTIARHLLDHRALVRGRRVLDFAAGSGIGAIAAALAGAIKVEAAEIDPMAAAAIRLNAARNGVAVETLLDDLLTSDVAGRWDLVLAGDVCYERPMAERAARWLGGLARDGVRVLLADPGRAYLPKTGLGELARYRVPTSLELEDRTERETVIYELLDSN